MPAYGLGTYGLGVYGIGEDDAEEAVYLGDFAFRVDLAPAHGPRDASPTYTAIASHVRLGDGPLVMKRGRGNEQDGPQPGSASMSLGNTDGRFTMGNPTSPYAPLKLRRPVRCRVTYQGVTYPLWQGHIDDWGNVAPSGVGRARLSLSDRLARAAGQPMRPALEAEILSDGPVGLWPLTDVEGAATAACTGSEFGDATIRKTLVDTNEYTSRIVFGTDLTIGPDSSLTATTLGSTGFEGEYLYATADGGFDAPGATIETFIDLPADRVSLGPFAVVDWQTVQVWITATGTVQATLGGISSPLASVTSQQSIAGSGWRHIAATWALAGTSGTLSLYIDGRLVGSATFGYGDTVIETGAEVSIGAPWNAFAEPILPAALSHIAVHTKALTAARIRDHALAATGWPAETSTARFARHCRNAGLTSTQYAVDGTGHTEMGPQPQAGASLMSLLSQCADAENGVLFVDRDGVLRFAARTRRYNTTPTLILDARKTGHVHTEAEVRTDTLLLVNDATATRPGGNPQRVTNPVSIGEYDTAERTATLHVNDDVICFNWSHWQVTANAEPRERLESIDVDVVAFVASGGSLGQLLGCDINSRIQAINLPATSAGTATLDLFVEGIQHRVEKSKWVLRFITSPVGIYDGIWQLGQGQLGSDTRLGF